MLQTHTLSERESVWRASPMPTLVRSGPSMVATPLRAEPRAYLRHVETKVYVSPTMVLSKSPSIIHVVIAAHLPSCRDRVCCGPHHSDRHGATLSRECFVLLVIVLILSKHNCKDAELGETYKAGC